jgi:choline-sulfatase
MRGRPRVGTVLLAALAGGLVTGLYDGIGAAFRAGVGFRAAFPAAILCGSVDLLVGAVIGLVVVVLGALAHWGRQRGVAPVALWVAYGLAGVAPAAAAAQMVLFTAGRNNRFLAAGMVAIVAVAVAVAAALCAPALARVLGAAVQLVRRRDPAAPLDHQPPPTPAGLLVAAPLAGLVLAALVFILIWQTRAPLRSSARVVRMVVAGIISGLIPAALVLAAAQLRQVKRRAAALVAAVVVVLPLLLFVRANWVKHLQFVPWRDVVVLALIALTGTVLAFALRRRTPPALQLAGIFAGAPVLAVLLALWAGGGELGRKAAVKEAGIVGKLIAVVQPMLDFDHDGYPGLLGGGDCNDEDPHVNPGAQDWPEDGLDQDCDGVDLRAADLRPPPLHPVPASVPADLNVLLIVIDTLRADHLGAYGYGRPTSPELDRLARDGVLFENAWAHAPSTRYSMPALITGRWPSAITWESPPPGASSNWPAISRRHITIAEVLRQQGYFNGAYYAYLYFNRLDGRGFERGIDQYDDRLAAKHVNKPWVGPAESVGSSAREMADDGIDFLKAYKDQKFFLSLHFYDTHLDYERHPDQVQFGDKQVDLYDGEILFTDRQVGRVIAALRELGIYDKTAVFVTGDHGEGLGEHHITAHGYDLYAPQTKVPLIARVPGLRARRVTAPVGHVDIAPTLVNLARAPQEPAFLGRSMLDVMAGVPNPKVPPPGPVFQEVSFPSEPPRFPAPMYVRHGLVSATHHLLWNWIPENIVSCYDVSKDPGELRDRWGTPTGAPACVPLKAELDRKLALLRLAELPPDFVARLAEGVSAPGAPAPPPSHARPAMFGDAVRFLGYDVKVLGVPFPGQLPTDAVAPAPGAAAPATATGNDPQVVRIARGGEVEVTTYFEVLKQLPGWRAFTHLDGPRGAFIMDHTPVGGAGPVERWRPGQKIRDRFTVRFTAQNPPGAHTLYVGFWKPPSSANQRLPVTPREAQDGSDRLRVVGFTVE